MSLSKEELIALRLLLQEELTSAIQPFREEVNQRFNEVASQIDGLYLRDEKREQEYLAIRKQVVDIEKKMFRSSL